MFQSLPKQTLGKTGPSVTRIALGCMGLAGTWNPAEVGPENIKRAIATFETAMDAGIDFYDHADIYGATTCESVFKECLRAVPGSREKIVIATKCGILLGRGYNLTADHIRTSIEGSISRMGIEYVDLYQMHRPDPFTHPRDTADGIRDVVKRGLVKHVGVSNYYPEQLRALLTYLDDIPIVSNQISISLLNLESIYEHHATGVGVLDQCMALDISPLAYSPLGGGWLSGRREVPADHPRKVDIDRTLAAIVGLGEKKGATAGQVATAWLLAHPSGIVPLVGSNNPDHIREAVGAVNVTLTRDEWFQVFTAARGKNVP